ncbi:36117_t:CDS:1, partial [Racocetra persica]
MGNCKSLWDQLLLKQITGLNIRLNSTGPEENLTRLRIKEGFSLVSASENNWHEKILEAYSRF